MRDGLAMASLLTLASCSSLADSDASQNNTPTPSVLEVVGPWEINGLDPLRAGSIFIRMQVAETLLDASGDGALLPGLASDWTASDDGLTWRFELRRDARFHDGKSVAPMDVVRSIERARDGPGSLSLAPIVGVQAAENAIVIKLKEPFAPLPSLLTHFSTQILAPSSFDANGQVREIIGTGPYRITSISLPLEFRVARFEEAKAQPSAIHAAHYLSVARAETRALLAESGQADIVFSLDPTTIERFRQRGAPRVEGVVVPRTVVLKVNSGHRWLRDVNVRRAISLAIDRDGIASVILRDPEMAATQLLPPDLKDWHNREMPPLRRDLEEGRRLLAEAGWKRGADGMLSRDGETFRLTMRTFPDRLELPEVASAIQDELMQLGIRTTIEVGDPSDIPLAHRDGTLEMALTARNYAIVPDPVGTLLWDFGGNGGDWGAMNWASPSLQTALQQLTQVTKNSERRRLSADVTQILQSELPVIPVVWRRLTAALSPRITNASIDPFERSFRIAKMDWAKEAAAR